MSYEQVHGQHPDHEEHWCAYCQGHWWERHECEACKGSGIKNGKPCAACDGHGWVSAAA